MEDCDSRGVLGLSILSLLLFPIHIDDATTVVRNSACDLYACYLEFMALSGDPFMVGPLNGGESSDLRPLVCVR